MAAFILTIVAAKVALLVVGYRVIFRSQCPGDCDDDCTRCGSGDWDLMCDECRYYLRDLSPAEPGSPT